MTSSTLPSSTPHDDAADRARASRELDTCIALDAGAGSGKTSVLTARLVALLERGASPRSIAAITFTEKAAGELVSRVRELLEERLASTDATPDAQKRLADVLDRFGELTISTIHSFCRDVLTLESLEADFAPDTEVGDETFAEQLLLDALRVWRDGLRLRRPELWTLLEQLVTSFALKNAASSLYRYRHYRDVACTAPFDAAKARTELQQLLRDVDHAAKACTKPEDPLLVKNAALVDRLNDVSDPKGDPLVGLLEALLSDEEPKTKRTGQAKSWPAPGSKDHYAACLNALADWKQRWREHAHGELLRDMREKLLPELDRQRRENSIATFDDLLTFAARLLRESTVARARLAKRFQTILIDEVQDTDPVQAEVATLLARPMTSSGAWDESAPEAGRLFAVGDPKQSIYRFRGADVGTFTRVKDVIVRNGERAALSRNFRSVPAIVEWVNAAFAGIAGYENQTAHREPALLDPIVVVDAFKAVAAREAADDIDSNDSAPPAVAAESDVPQPANGTEVDEIEGALRHLHSLFTSGAKVFDKQTKELRPLQAKDVMVLLPAWAKADVIADRFRAAGYECVVEGGDTFFERDEVRLGMAALRAFAEPADTEATAFLLRGMFGLSLDELAKHTAAGGSLRFTLPNPPPVSRVADAMQSLGKIHRGRGTRSLSVLLDELFDITRVTAVWSALPDGKSRLANLDKLKAMLRNVEAQTTSPLAAVEELQRIERNVANKDIDRIDDDGNAIRVTSLFKAKGLEAPVVMLMFSRRKTDAVYLIVDHKKAEVAIRMSVLAPPHWEELKKNEDANEYEERRRWMYVAATRARDQLVIVRTIEMTQPKDDGAEPFRKTASGCLLRLDIDRALPEPREADHDELIECMGVEMRMRCADELPPAPRSTKTFSAIDDAVNAHLTANGSMVLPSDTEGVSFVAKRKQKLREAKRGCVRWRAASGEPTNKVWRPGISIDASTSADEASDVVATTVGARGGRVVHAVMERLDLSRPHDELVARGTDLAALLATQAGLPDELIKACQHIVTRILANPLVDKARKAPERWPEVPFTYSPREGTVISGTIDLCFPLDETRKKWAVFDWKSRVPPPDDALRARYETQLKRYATALLSAMGDGVEVTELQIVGPYPELGVQADPGDVLGDVRGDLREPLAALMKRGAPEPDVYDDVGDPPVAAPDLSWPLHKLAIVVDAASEQVVALQAIGWTVKHALDEEVAQLLGLAPLPPAPSEDA